MIDTQADLIKYVRRQLGEPLITVEVTDDMIIDHIEYCIQKFSEYSYQGQTRDSFGFDTIPGVYDYYLDDSIKEVIVVKGMSYTGVATINIPNNEMIVYNNHWSVQASNASSVAGATISSFVTNMANQELIESLFDKDVNFSFNSNSKLLRFHETPQGRYVLYVSTEYVPKDKDRIYNHEWIKKMVTSKTKFTWGTITGKYDQSLVSGARINYSDMKSEAQQEIDILNEELVRRYIEPAPLFVG